ncbi:MAG: sigma-54-dependent Fis family transcriptional regulator [Pseudodesulfovibrio sp.]|uniref:sigma-54-dependent Fis family transcriptional regulator n=1 Tax=Pseudodesulfovibrio sp. TaxID=2035812 RepID=UPI003D10421F
MHLLTREGEGFEIRRNPYMQKSCFRLPTSGGREQRGAQVDYASWKDFVDGKRAALDIDQALMDSWSRCRSQAVDPAPRRCWDFMPMDQMAGFTTTLERICGEVESTAFEIIKDKGLLITITNAEGRVARTLGDRDVLRMADSLNFGPGANWAESCVGTNAIGTALATGRPMQVFGEEHYCRSHHAWNCTAAPILDPRGNVWGSFDISGPTESDHSRALDIVLSAARALEQRLSKLYCSELEGQMASLFSSMFNSAVTGVLFLDRGGRITSANNAAERLLVGANKTLRGRKGDEFFELDTYLAQAKDAVGCDPVPLKYRHGGPLFAQALPTFSAGGDWLDTIVTLTEARPTSPMVSMAPVPNSDRIKGFEHVLYVSSAMRDTIHRAANAARTPSTVLLSGESGTGKELFARGIHQAGPRAAYPFVAVNCGAFTEELVQSELFGYREGAFTGAAKRGRIGKFQKADKGVLFLDEISEMPLSQQVNLLRALEERAIVPVGGSTPLPVDVKIVAATNKDLAELVRQGKFREDLYYRLNVVGISIPPLRERASDVNLLAEYHLRQLCTRFGIPVPQIGPDAASVLSAHDWPGNVRELVNCLEYAANNLSDGWLRAENLPPYLLERTAGAKPAKETADRGFLLQDREAETIREALRFHGGNISQTAKALGIGRNTLYVKLERYGIET